jgi:hypothetical protein
VMLVKVPDGGGVMNQNIGIKDIINRAGCHYAASSARGVINTMTLLL